MIVVSCILNTGKNSAIMRGAACARGLQLVDAMKQLLLLSTLLAMVSTMLMPGTASACSPAVTPCTQKIPFDSQIVPIGVTAMPFSACNAKVDPTMAALSSADGKTFTLGYDGQGLTFGSALPAGTYTITVQNPGIATGGTEPQTKGTFTVQNAPPQPTKSGTLVAPVSALPAQAGSTEGCGTAELPAGQRVDVQYTPDVAIAPWLRSSSDTSSTSFTQTGPIRRGARHCPSRLASRTAAWATTTS